MKFGSVCSGIEAASVAWHPLGWTAAWLSEIEPFPCALLKHHYPDVPNHGDMTLLPEKILSGQVEAPDLFCGGTPCQAFSVAGLRNSLDDARGNLSLTFVGIANAIDHVRSLRGDSPAIVFWENVPGVLNTKDNAFGCFLGALAGESDPIKPPGERWSNAGCVFGPQRTVAWRVLDAQYFGVAQRRRRVFVVASARDDINPAEILFEFEGVRRDTPQSRKEGQEVAGTIAARFGISRNNIEESDAVVGALDTECGGKKMNHQTVDSGHIVAARMVAFGEYSVDGTASAMKARDWKDATDLVAQPVAVYENHPSDSRVTELGDVSSTVRARWGTGGGNAPMVAQPIAYNITFCDANGTRSDRPNGGLYVNETDVTSTLTKAGIGTNVAQPIAFPSTLSGTQHASAENIAPSMGAKNPTAVAFNIAPGKGELKDDIHVTDAHVSKTIDASGSNPAMHQGGAAIVQPVGFDSYNLCETGDVTQTLKSPSGGVTESIGAVHIGMAVRRLTPVECERLQGFPDGYTNIPWRKAAESPDGPRYKALGNSWAVPVVAWIGQRIQNQLK